MIQYIAQTFPCSFFNLIIGFSKNGMRPDHQGICNITAVVPSNQDTEYTLALEEGLLEDRNSMIATSRTEMEMKGETESRGMTRLQANKQASENRIQQMRGYQRHAGTLFAGSGERATGSGEEGTDQNYILDWALIELAGHRTILNKVISS